MILEGNAQWNEWIFVYTETKDNNKTYQQNWTWLDSTLQMCFQNGGRILKAPISARTQQHFNYYVGKLQMGKEQR